MRFCLGVLFKDISIWYRSYFLKGIAFKRHSPVSALWRNGIQCERMKHLGYKNKECNLKPLPFWIDNIRSQINTQKMQRLPITRSSFEKVTHIGLYVKIRHGNIPSDDNCFKRLTISSRQHLQSLSRSNFGSKADIIIVTALCAFPAGDNTRSCRSSRYTTPSIYRVCPSHGALEHKH